MPRRTLPWAGTRPGPTRSGSWEPPLDAAIPCRLYRINGPHPDNARTVHDPDPRVVFPAPRRLVYVGECVDTDRRSPRDRWAEHLDLQPWGDTIPTRAYDAAIADGTLVVDDVIYPTKRAVKRAEQAAIMTGQPLYNWVHNQLNRHQIPKWTAIAQRAERDRINQVPTHQTWAALNGLRPVTWWRKPLLRWGRLRRRDRKRIIAAGLWTTVAVVVGVAVAVVSPLSVPASMAVGAGTTAVTRLWLGQPTRRRKVRYAANQAARWLIAVATVAAVLADLTRS